MGYARYRLPDGRMAGYGVSAECDGEGCTNVIDRGLGYLCGNLPDGHRDPDDWGCGLYFCGQHEHDCANPDCGLYSSDGYLFCKLGKAHDGPHRDRCGTSFTETEEDEQ